MEPSFDDSDWKSEAATAFSGVMPWNQLEPRGIPLLEEHLTGPARCLGTAKGRCADDYDATRDAARLRHTEGLAHAPCDFLATEIRTEAAGKNRFRSYLLDFGRTVVGSVGFQILGALGGEILDTLHVETVDADTLTPHYTPDKHSRMAFAHRLVCRPGDQSHTFYHPFGFRYMVLTVRDSTRALTIRPHLRSTLYPLVQNGAFTSSDAGLNKIWNACAWTQRVCSLDAYVDTPWREQAQWWGDSRVQAKTTFFYSGDTRLFRRGLAQIAGQTAPNGLTYGHAPTMAHSCILPDFSLVWLITLWDFYWQTGSMEPLLAHQKTIDGILGYFEDYTDPQTGLVGFDKRYWLFLDWTGLFKDGYSTVYNLWLLIALERLSLMYGRTNHPDAAKKLAAWAKRLRKALGHVVRADGLLSDGLNFARKPVKETSLHAQTLAMIAGFQPKRNTQRIRDVLLPFIRQETKPEIYPSCYWITYVFEALTTAGHGAEVIRFIRDKWAPMADYGTTWELFEPRVGDESFSHAWSAHPLFHLMQTIGGIRQNAPEWTEIIYEPVFEGAFNKTIVPTPHGKIRSAWKRTGAQIKVTLNLPKGVSAIIRLPGQKQAAARGASSWTIKSAPPALPSMK